jgi:hypothetical protein
VLYGRQARGRIQDHDGDTHLFSVSKRQEPTTKIAFVPVRYALAHLSS